MDDTGPYMTREALEFRVDGVIAAAKDQIEMTGDFSPLFLLHYDSDWHPFRMPKRTQGLLNSGDAKRVLFAFFRRLVADSNADAAIFTTDTWVATVTLEGLPHY